MLMSYNPSILQNPLRCKKLPNLVLFLMDVTIVTLGSIKGYIFLFANGELIRTLHLQNVKQNNTIEIVTFVTNVYSKYQKLQLVGVENGY